MLKTNWFLWPARLAWATGHRRHKCLAMLLWKISFVAGGFAIAILPLYPLCTVVVDVENLGLGFTTRKVFIQEKAIFS